MAFACDICQKAFHSLSLVNRHKRQVHKLNIENLARGRPRGTTHVCPICNWSTANKRMHERHIRFEHEKKNLRIKVQCPVQSCSHWFCTRQEMCNHVLFDHTDEIAEGSSITEMYFSDMEDFHKWKARKEAESGLKYVLTSAPQDRTYGKQYRYFCNRCGTYPRKGKGNQDSKLQAVRKTVSMCPAMITMCNQGVQVHVNFSDVHYGHNLEVHYLSKKEQEEMARQLAENNPFEVVLKNMRDTLNYHETIKSFILQVDTLNSIIHDFNLETDNSSEMKVEIIATWTEELQRVANESIRYLKFHAIADEALGLSDEDFALVIMTDLQKEVLLDYGENGFICIDRISAYNFSFTTLLVVDEYNEGFPVAFCYSDRDDCTVLKCFFNVIKISVGDAISVKFLMADDDDSVYDTWTDVMGAPESRLLCSWHVDKMWRKMIASYVQINDELKVKIYKHLRALLFCEDIHSFYFELDSFLNTCEYAEATKEFGEWFLRDYIGRCEQWAYCYRLGMCINPDMHIEVFHKVLKQVVTRGLKLCRVDMSINALMAILRRKILYSKWMMLSGSKLTELIKLINQRHADSLMLDTEDVILDNGCLRVQSDDGGEPYRVKHEAVATNHVNCKLKCSDCDVCIHNFSCTCSEYSLQAVICKHIHLVVRKETGLPPLVKNEMEIDGEMNDYLDNNLKIENDDEISDNNELQMVDQNWSNTSSELGEIHQMMEQLTEIMQDENVVSNPVLVSHVHQHLLALFGSLDSSNEDQPAP